MSRGTQLVNRFRRSAINNQQAAVERSRKNEGRRNPVVVARVYEHPFAVRLCHWANAVSLFVMVGSGLQIFRAFPSFGAKIPQKDLLNWPKRSPSAAGWAGRCNGT
jgi:hypothetical protein